MELYILDPLFRRMVVVDQYQSLIWTERFNNIGDFELLIQLTPQNKELLVPGTLLAMNKSDRIMKLETVETSLSNDGVWMLKCGGPSFEAILKDRVAMKLKVANTPASGVEPVWQLEGKPASVARTIVNDICIEGTVSLSDKIPFLTDGVFGRPSLIPEPEDVIKVDIEPTSVYDAISEICKVWNLGFRIQREPDNSVLRFNVYSGTDRTSGQTGVPSVLFTPELDNLTNIKEFHSIEGSKNVAYVVSPETSIFVYPPDVDPDDTTGWERRVLVVKANDITSENTSDIPATLTRIGKDELAKARGVKAFDGQVNQNSHYKYGSDYFLGDIVELRNYSGVANLMRVTEQIFVSDEQGERSYPTLELNIFVTTGSWLSWASNRKWIDFDGEQTGWADLP